MNKKAKVGGVKIASENTELSYNPKLHNFRAGESMLPNAEAVKKPQKIYPHIFINEELPEDSDDEEYKPGPEDLQDQSEEETGRQSVSSTISTLDVSPEKYLENFDSNLLISESPNQSTDHIFKIPEENIGQRTRSKLCLSDTPLEAIEEAFVPPDITTDMYNFKCDDEDWEKFLIEFMQPLSNDTNDPDDDEADPDYNVTAEEERVDEEEHRPVKISRKELRKLITEIFESPDEYSSDEEEEKRVRTEITNRVQSDMKKQAAEKAKVKREDIEDKNIWVTKSQRLLIDQQLRQHIQLTTQNFLQTCQHPLYGKYAEDCKIILATLLELSNSNADSAFNIFNLKIAFSLVEKWEKFLLTKEGEDVISHMNKEMIASQKARKKGNFHRIEFHPSLIKLISESQVFLYPLLLPPLGFRCDGPFKPEFIPPEDSLIAIGLEEFTQYISKHPNLFKRKNTVKTAVELTCEHLLVTKKPSQVYRHIRNVRNLENNPLQHYYKYKEAPRTVHYVIPLNENMNKAPKEYEYFLLPKNFQKFLNKGEFEFMKDDNG